MIDLTKPLRTKKGHLVRILATDVKGGYPIAGVIQYSDDREGLCRWTREGKTFRTGESVQDLENIPEEKKHFTYVAPDHYIGNVKYSSLEKLKTDTKSMPMQGYLEITTINNKITEVKYHAE